MWLFCCCCSVQSLKLNKIGNFWQFRTVSVFSTNWNLQKTLIVSEFLYNQVANLSKIIKNQQQILSLNTDNKLVKCGLKAWQSTMICIVLKLWEHFSTSHYNLYCIVQKTVIALHINCENGTYFSAVNLVNTKSETVQSYAGRIIKCQKCIWKYYFSHG